MFTLLASYTVALSPNRIVYDSLPANESCTYGMCCPSQPLMEGLLMRLTLFFILSGEDRSFSSLFAATTPALLYSDLFPSLSCSCTRNRWSTIHPA